MKRLILILMIIVTLIGIASILPEEQLSDKIRIGVSDDSSGFVVDYMLREEKLDSKEELEAYFIKDCWAKTSQWALSSDMLDMAIVCKEAANTFLENIEGFEIVGECVSNSDIFIINPEVENPKTIGMTQDRDYQKELISKRFGENVETFPLTLTALPYSLANKNVDAIVIDLMKGIHVDGIKEDTLIDGDYSTYVLIVNSDFKKSKDYRTFIKIYNDSLEELLKDEGKMEKQFFDYTGKKLEKGGLEKWKIKLQYIMED